jgi:hypothetical protein
LNTKHHRSDSKYHSRSRLRGKCHLRKSPNSSRSGCGHSETSTIISQAVFPVQSTIATAPEVRYMPAFLQAINSVSHENHRGEQAPDKNYGLPWNENQHCSTSTVEVSLPLAIGIVRLPNWTRVLCRSAAEVSLGASIFHDIYSFQIRRKRTRNRPIIRKRAEVAEYSSCEH